MNKSTRGSGLLENLLARLRCRQALKMTADINPCCSLLDIGCGKGATWLKIAPFEEKHGLDNYAKIIDHNIIVHQAPENGDLSFIDKKFDIVTILATIEHLDKDHASYMLCQAWHRLHQWGRLIITTPNAWTRPLLEGMADIGLLSKEEIYDHKHYYTPEELKRLVEIYRFHNVKVGTFQFGANIYLEATK